MRSRQRVSKLLLRQGIVWSGGAAWTGKHELWLRQQRFDRSGLQLAFDVEFEAVLMAAARRDRLDKAIEKMAGGSEYTPVVRRPCCLRGVSTLTGFALAVEVGDEYTPVVRRPCCLRGVSTLTGFALAVEVGYWHRFSGSTIGAYLGLVPTERSSGQSRSQGSITKTGNTHARRLLVEAAWHHAKPYRTPGLTMQARWAQATPAAQARGHLGNQRLKARWEVFTDRRKRPVIANVAIARDMADIQHLISQAIC